MVSRTPLKVSLESAGISRIPFSENQENPASHVALGSLMTKVKIRILSFSKISNPVCSEDEPSVPHPLVILEASPFSSRTECGS